MHDESVASDRKYTLSYIPLQNISEQWSKSTWHLTLDSLEIQSEKYGMKNICLIFFYNTGKLLRFLRISVVSLGSILVFFANLFWKRWELEAYQK